MPTIPAQLALAATVVFAGQVRLGMVTSFTVAVKVHWLLFPASSVAVRVTVLMVLCPESTVPLTGDWVTLGLAEQLSLSEAGE